MEWDYPYIFGDAKPASEIESTKPEDLSSAAVFPLAMPSIASPRRRATGR